MLHLECPSDGSSMSKHVRDVLFSDVTDTYFILLIVFSIKHADTKFKLARLLSRNPYRVHNRLTSLILDIVAGQDAVYLG
jgi:hypothetical protein